MGHLGEISTKDRNRFRVEIDGRQATQAGTLQSKAESAAAAEEVNEGWPG